MRRALLFVALALGAALTPAPASAAGSGTVCASWGCGSFDFILTSSGPKVIGMADDAAEDGSCVYLYVKVNGQWGRWTDSCGPASTRSATLPHGTTIGHTAILTRSPWGATRFNITDPNPGL